MKRSASNPDADLLELVGDIYQAGLEPERWPALMARLSQSFDADLACIYTPVAPRPEQSLYITHNFSEEMESAYAAYYHSIDEWSGTALRQHRYVRGLVAVGEDIIPQRDLRRTEFYQDFLKRYDMEWIVSSVLFEAGPETPATHMTFTRHLGRGAYDEAGIRVMHLLAPHVRRALLTHWRLNRSRFGEVLHESALDSLGYGIALLGENGQAIHLNALAEQVARADDGIKVQAGFLLVSHAAEQAALLRLLRQAALGVGGGISVKRSSGKRPYGLTAIPLLEAHRFRALGEASVLLLIHDPEAVHSADSLKGFAALHRLTPAELRVLTLLLADHSPKEIAARLEVSIRTVRSQLSSLYTKTGTKNQRDLVVTALAGGAMP